MNRVLTVPPGALAAVEAASYLKYCHFSERRQIKCLLIDDEESVVIAVRVLAANQGLIMMA